MTAPDSPAPDDLDRVFAGYLKVQLPDPFPAFARPAAEPSALRWERNALAGVSGRLALAASVAGLLGLGMWLSSGPRPEVAGPKSPASETGLRLLDGATADGGKLQPPAP